MGVADLVAKALAAGDFASYFAKPSSSLDVEEPVAVAQGAFRRESRIEGEERGAVPVTVFVVREASADAEALATSIEQHLRHFDWERCAEAWPWRVAGIDTSAPFLKERDSSGRFVWAVEAEVTAVRSI